MTDHSANKKIILDYFDAIEKSCSQDIAETIGKFIADDYHWYGCIHLKSKTMHRV